MTARTAASKTNRRSESRQNRSSSARRSRSDTLQPEAEGVVGHAIFMSPYSAASTSLRSSRDRAGTPSVARYMLATCDSEGGAYSYCVTPLGPLTLISRFCWS